MPQANRAVRVIRRIFRPAAAIAAAVLIFGVFMVAQDWAERSRMLAIALLLAVYSIFGFED
jgi:hypothetical protein